MESLHLERAEASPELFLDPARGTILIKGRSLMEDTLPFYQMIIDWIREYFKSPKSMTTVTFELEYVNSASLRMITEILFEVNKFYIFGNDAVVEWRFYSDDEDMEEMGMELDEMLDMPFEYIVLS